MHIVDAAWIVSLAGLLVSAVGIATPTDRKVRVAAGVVAWLSFLAIAYHVAGAFAVPLGSRVTAAAFLTVVAGAVAWKPVRRWIRARELVAVEETLPETVPEEEVPLRNEPRTPRMAAFELAREIREHFKISGRNFGTDRRDLSMMHDFYINYQPRLVAIKGRLRSIIVPRWDVVSEIDLLPDTRENIRRIADTLEREALRVPKDVPE